MVEKVECPECGLAEGHAIMCGSKDYRRKKRKLSRTDTTPSVAKDGATGEGDEFCGVDPFEHDLPSGSVERDLRLKVKYAHEQQRALESGYKTLTEQLAATNAEITTWQQQCDSVQQTNDALAKRLLKQEAEIERLTVYANPLTERLAIAHSEIERLLGVVSNADEWCTQRVKARDAVLAQCEELFCHEVSKDNSLDMSEAMSRRLRWEQDVRNLLSAIAGLKEKT